MAKINRIDVRTGITKGTNNVYQSMKVYYASGVIRIYHDLFPQTVLKRLNELNESWIELYADKYCVERTIQYK